MGRTFLLSFALRKVDYFIDFISISYNEVPPGEKVAVFNSNDLLEIAINRGASKTNGGAQQLFGLNKKRCGSSRIYSQRL